MKAEDYLKTSDVIYEVKGHFFHKKKAAEGVAKQLRCEVITHRKEDKEVETVVTKKKVTPKKTKTVTASRKKSIKKD